MIWQIVPSLISFLSLMTVLLVMAKQNRKSRKVPPGPEKIPIIGNLHQVGKLPHRSLQKLSETYGDLMFLQLGSVPALVVSSAARARDIFKNHDLAISGRPTIYPMKKIAYNLSSVSTAPYGDYWREARKIMVLELMTPKRVDSFRHIRAEEVARMIERVATAATEPTPLDLSSVVFALSNTVVSRAAFGTTNNVVVDDFQRIFGQVQHLSGEIRVADFFPRLGWINKINGVDRRVDDIFRDLDSFFNKLIDEHRHRTLSDANTTHEDIIDVLLRLQKDSRQTIRITNQQLKGVLLDIFVAGTDTSAATIVWTMAELIRNPSVKEKAQQEVREIANGKAKVEETDLPKLKFLKQVIKESFRLHPPAPLLVPRETTELCIIDGKYEIPAKTRVFFNASAMSRDPRVWEKPTEFLPERFENSQVDFRGQHFELLPFGAGRRGCPGIGFSIPVVELALANLLFCFDWKLPEGISAEDVDMEEAVGITMHKNTPLCLLPSPAVTVSVSQ